MRKVLLSERIKHPPRFMTIEPYLREVDHPVASDPLSREPRIVPLVVFDYGSVAARLRQMRYVGRMLVGAVKELVKSARSIRDNPYEGRTTIDVDTLAEVEAYARSLGATDIGYTVVEPRWIFRDFRILFPNAMVFTIEMDKDKINQAPSMPSFIEIFRTYYTVGVVVNKVAEFLRSRGYNAHAGPAVGGDVNYVPLAIDAGLGYSGKSGMLITKEHGPRVRLAAVYTDIANLPFAEHNPYQWVRDYCQTCNLCIEKCPADAIYQETRVHADGGPIFVDHTKCADPFSNDNGCTLCIKYCPFSHVDYDILKARWEREHQATPV